MSTIAADAGAVRAVGVARVDPAGIRRADDRVAVESALEVRLNGEPFSVIMRTPGDDRHLALGFLFTERVIGEIADVARIDDGEHVIDVVLTPARAEVAREALRGRRQVVTNASCGMCGRRNLESLDVEGDPFVIDWQVNAGVVRSLSAALSARQSAFAETGGLHAAGVFDLGGRLLASAEDVGRHNAVDKLLGRALSEGRLPLDRRLLFVSGRSSFEIVQKAWLGGIQMVAAVSAPSSLAIDLADRCGMTLAGFVRDERFNIYTHDARIALNG